MSKVKIIIVNGLSRSGKDSFINAVRWKVPASEVHSTIDTVRNALRDSCMIDHEKKDGSERKFLMRVKRAWIAYNDGPFQEIIKRVAYLEDHYKFMENIKEVLLFVQVREPQEMYKIHTHFIPNVYSVLVERPGVLQQSGDEEVFDFDYDYNIYNDGTLEDLNVEACEFLRFLREAG